MRLATISGTGSDVGFSAVIHASNATLPDSVTTAQVSKAWVNFNGTGAVSIRDSFNVSSITDNGAGDYTVNFTNAMSDANYAFASDFT